MSAFVLCIKMFVSKFNLWMHGTSFAMSLCNCVYSDFPLATLEASITTEMMWPASSAGDKAMSEELLLLDFKLGKTGTGRMWCC